MLRHFYSSNISTTWKSIWMSIPTWCIDESKRIPSTIVFIVETRHSLGNSPSLCLCDICPPDRIQQCGFTVVLVSHNSNDRLFPAFIIFRAIIGGLQIQWFRFGINTLYLRILWKISFQPFFGIIEWEQYLRFLIEYPLFSSVLD